MPRDELDRTRDALAREVACKESEELRFLNNNSDINLCAIFVQMTRSDLAQHLSSKP